MGGGRYFYSIGLIISLKVKKIINKICFSFILFKQNFIIRSTNYYETFILILSEFNLISLILSIIETWYHRPQ